MIEAQYIWKNGQIIAWDQPRTHVLTHGLHYGSAVFEGIRCYLTDYGPAVFKLEEHVKRFFYSAKQLGMQFHYSERDICQAILDTLKKNNSQESYVRPLAFYGYGSMKVVPTTSLPVDIIIACWPWSHYLPVATVDVVTSPYVRIHPKSTVTDAKISGHYVNSILAGLVIRNTHYHEALLLDAQGFVAEGGAENIFIVKDGKIFTPPTGTILIGITRNTVIQIAEKFGLPVEEELFTPEEIYQADEAFFCGTAVEITPIRSLDDKLIAQGNIGAITAKIKNEYHRVVHGKVSEFDTALTFVDKSQEVMA